MDLTPTARRRWEALVEAYPTWEPHRRVMESGELEVYVPSPNPQVGGLIVLTSGQDTWIRFSPPQMLYLVDDDEEMLNIVRWLLADEVLFVRITSKGQWTERPSLLRTESRHWSRERSPQVLSWTGRHDRIVGNDGAPAGGG